MSFDDEPFMFLVQETIFSCHENLVVLNEAYPFPRFSWLISKLDKGDGVIRGNLVICILVIVGLLE